MTYEEAVKIAGTMKYRKIISAWQMSSSKDTRTIDIANRYKLHAELNKGGGQAHFSKLAEAYAILADTRFQEVAK